MLESLFLTKIAHAVVHAVVNSCSYPHILYRQTFGFLFALFCCQFGTITADCLLKGECKDGNCAG